MMDALAALHLWAYEISFPRVLGDDGRPHLFRIEPAPAADWLIATFQQGHLSYLPGMLSDDDQERIADAIFDGHLHHDDLVKANRDCIEQISGWPWWAAGKLMGTLYHRFDLIGGLLVLSGVDLRTQPLGAVLAAVNARVLENKTKEDRTKWLNELAMPPAETLDPDNWDEDVADRALEMMMAAGPAGGFTSDNE